MPRRTSKVFQSIYLMNTTQIFRESVRILLLHATHFHYISIFLFSPFPISLFISHSVIHHFPHLTSSIFTIIDIVFQHYGIIPLPKLLPKTLIHSIICFPTSITFSLLGKALTVQAISDIYNGVNLDGKRLILRSGSLWIKLLHINLCEFLIIILIFGFFVTILTLVPKILFLCGICSWVLGFWGVLGFLGIPFCVTFANLMVVGNLARILCVLESQSYGFKSLIKANGLVEGRRQTALVMTLMSNLGFRLVEFLFEFRMPKGINLWEGPMLVSMYSMIFVFETIMSVVFYYSCKPLN